VERSSPNSYSNAWLRISRRCTKTDVTYGERTVSVRYRATGQGKLNNGKISAQDVARALDIYGPDLGSSKGKTTSRKPQLEEESEIINLQFESQTMYLDLMFANGESFIISVTKPLEYVLVTKLSK
jgi:hypothetical protein